MAFRAIRVVVEGSEATAGVATCVEAELPQGDTLVRVAWSSINYKDALSMAGHRGVTRVFPATPGIDAAGFDEATGEAVIVHGHDLGMNTWGGLGERIRVPREWVVPLPPGLSLRAAMVFGTAGFTAVRCIDELEREGVRPESGPVVVSGATGGVGSFAVALLGAAGYHVVAATGKTDRADDLRAIGATEVIHRDELARAAERGLGTARWAGAVDTTGGAILGGIVRELQRAGAAVTCGVAQSAELPLTVYPFILRAARLVGVDAAETPHDERIEIWNRIAARYRDHYPVAFVNEVELADAPVVARTLLEGTHVGRTVVRVTGEG